MYFVNPFCTSVNPAAKTKLNQSGDVDAGSSKNVMTILGSNQTSVESSNNKISLKWRSASP